MKSETVGPYSLRLLRDSMPPGGRHSAPLGSSNRVVYVLEGEAVVTSQTKEARVAQGAAWFGPAECAVAGGARGADLLRYELRSATRLGADPPASEGMTTRVLLEHPIELSSDQPYLMRCDRVDFGPGDEALPHRHKGGGIRCLIAGTIEVTVGDEPPRLIRPGEAWFESGREPVYAVASKEEPTSFIRVSVLPRAIRGQSSIMYVDPADASRGRPRKYTVLVDEPIEIS